MIHGQSEDYTPLKQKHIRGILNTCRYGLTPKDWTHDEVFFVDCTAGAGYAENGEPGSPFIFNEFARESYKKFKHLCCEKDRHRYAELKTNSSGLENATIERGDYNDIVPGWLNSQGNKKPALGIIYCDANGAKDLLHGIKTFRAIAQDRRFSSIDFLFHWSIVAYNRNRGAGSTWAGRDILDVTDELASLKKHAFIRLPTGRWDFVIMHMLNTSKVNPSWKTERIVSYSDWKAEQISADQMELFELTA